MIQFTLSKVDIFENNTLDGIYKGIRFMGNSIGVINNCTFKNFVQNEQENSAVQSILNEDGSAIGKKFSLFF
jgi:hypothetical protein